MLEFIIFYLNIESNFCFERGTYFDLRLIILGLIEFHSGWASGNIVERKSIAKKLLKF